MNRSELRELAERLCSAINNAKFEADLFDYAPQYDEDYKLARFPNLTSEAMRRAIEIAELLSSSVDALIQRRALDPIAAELARQDREVTPEQAIAGLKTLVRHYHEGKISGRELRDRGIEKLRGIP